MALQCRSIRESDERSRLATRPALAMHEPIKHALDPKGLPNPGKKLAQLF